MKMHWKLSEMASCFWACQRVAQTRNVEANYQEALREPVEVLKTTLREERVPADTYWKHLQGLAADFDSPGQLAEVALNKTIGALEARMRLGRFQRNVTQMRKAFQVATALTPKTLAPAWKSLRMQWDLHGQGLLGGMAQWTDPDLLVEEATVIGVMPASAGGGAAHLAKNRVVIEVVAETGEIPEVLRLAWLLGQLNLDLPRFSEQVSSAHRDLAPALAMIPIVLVAAEPLKLGSVSQLEMTLPRWMPEAARTLATVQTWWEVYQAMRPSWPDALQALDRLLLEASGIG